MFDFKKVKQKPKVTEESRFMLGKRKNFLTTENTEKPVRAQSKARGSFAPAGWGMDNFLEIKAAIGDVANPFWELRVSELQTRESSQTTSMAGMNKENKSKGGRQVRAHPPESRSGSCNCSPRPLPPVTRAEYTSSQDPSNVNPTRAIKGGVGPMLKTDRRLPTPALRPLRPPVCPQV